MPLSPRRAALLVLSALFTTNVSAADPCFRDLGSKAQFGSDDQMKELQKLAATGCSAVGFTFKLTTPARSTLVIADLDEGEMLRLKIDAVSRPWEKWSGFTRQDLIRDDPSDGFDLKGFSPSSSNQRPAIPRSLKAFIEKNQMQTFLP